MAERIAVVGYEEFKNYIEKIDKTKLINCYFTGSKDEDGMSWCPDCNRAEPYILSAVEKYATEGSIFITCQVGDRAAWKDLANSFRTDKCTRLIQVPTLLRWQNPQRLDGDYYCSKDDILELFFTDELD